MNPESLQSQIALGELDVVELGAPGNADEPKNEPINAGDEPINEPKKGDLSGQKSVLSGHVDPINDLLNEIRKTPAADYATLAAGLGVSEATVKRNIQKLKRQDRIRRIGSKKTGHWEVIE